MNKNSKKQTALQPQAFDVVQIAVKNIDPSPANKRRNFDVKELAENIKAQGLLHPVVVRTAPKNKKRYELVSGERRWRAFELLNCATIPAVVRELTDEQAHDITASENLQREDLTVIEEAESVKVLLDDGRAAQEVADRLGKPVGWVVRRARLADLSPWWLKAISDRENGFSRWTATHLELIGRYDHDRQEEIGKTLGDRYNTENWTARELEEWLSNTMFELKMAPWSVKDATLTDAGACVECQKRTGCQAELFEPLEVKIAATDRCLDSSCWGKKLVAFNEAKIRENRQKYPKMVLIDKSNNSDSRLPEKHPWTEKTEETYRLHPAKKSDPDAFPAYVIDGPGVGKIVWMKTPEWARESRAGKKTNPDGSPAPKSIEEKQEGLEKRRLIRLINNLMLMLTGEEKKAIAEQLTPPEVFALVCAFGAERICYEMSAGTDEDLTDAEQWENRRWKIIFEILQHDSPASDAAVQVFGKIVSELKQVTYAPQPDRSFVEKVCRALHLSYDELWKKVVEEIPEPKSWKKGLKDLLPGDGEQPDDEQE